MNVLVTGNLGYIGSILVPELVKKNYNVTGLDIGFFKDCLISDYKKPHKQIIKEVIAVYDTNTHIFCIMMGAM